MEPTNRSKVGNSQGGQTPPPVDGVRNSSPLGYDPIFSPTGMAGADSGIYKGRKAPEAPEAPVAPPDTQPIEPPQLEIPDLSTEIPPQPTIPANSLTPTPQQPPVNQPIPPQATPIQPAQPAPQPRAISSAAIPAPAPNPQHTTSTATGDIILQPSQDAPGKKSNLPVIILIIIAAVAIIAGLAVLIINPFGSSNNSSADSSTVASFNKFMNYLYDGSESTELNEDAYDDSKVYKLDSILDSDDATEREEYFTVAQRLLSDVITLARDDEKLNSDETLTALDALSTNFPVLSLANTTPALDMDEIVIQYSQAPSTAEVGSYLDQYYRPFTDSDSQLAQNYGNNLIAANNTMAEQLDIVKNYDCISAQKLDVVCVNNIPHDSTDWAKFSQNEITIYSLLDDNQDISTNATTEVIRQSLTLGKIINNIEDNR